MAAQRRLAACGLGGDGRDGDRTHTDRFDDRTGAPASGGGIKNSGPRGLGRSRGGLSTKLHLAVDGAGQPLRSVIAAGRVHDVSSADELVEHLPVGAVIADKGYDSDTFVERIRANRANAVIPPRSKRKRHYSRVLFHTRNIVERLLNDIKHSSRVSTRYGKLVNSYFVFASLACAFGPFVKM